VSRTGIVDENPDLLLAQAIVGPTFARAQDRASTHFPKAQT